MVTTLKLIKLQHDVITMIIKAIMKGTIKGLFLLQVSNLKCKTYRAIDSTSINSLDLILKLYKVEINF